MRSTRRAVFTGALVVALALGLSPFHQIEFTDPAPDVVEAELAVDGQFNASEDGWKRTDPIDAPITFTGLWLNLEVAADVEVDDVNVRTSEDGKQWSEWSELGMLDAYDGPDADTGEDASYDEAATVSELFIADDSDYVQFEVPDAVTGIEVQFADASGANDSVFTRVSQWFGRSPVPAAEASDTPEWIVPREEWGAKDPQDDIEYADDGVKMTVVHHTASTNDYSRDGVHNQLRIIQNYHMSLGWADVGYNVLIDKFGRIYEGRDGGLDRSVVGAHARGYNTGSFGVSVIGNFTDRQAPQAAIDALTRVIGYKAGVHGFNPGGNVEMNGGNHSAVVGHQNVGQTACPGRIQDRLPEIRAGAAIQTDAPFSPFLDIGPANQHGHEVLSLYAAGVINGCERDRYCPGDNLTRGQAAALIARSLNLSNGDGSVFDDIAPGSVHDGAIGAVAERGIVTGYDDGTFRPGQALTREQMASILARSMNLRPSNGSAFTDVSGSSVHGGNVYALAESGITQGCNDTQFCPADSLTRAQMASFVYRMREHLGLD